jgi:hypothetical protein
MAFEKVTLRERPDLEEQLHRLNHESWPTFLLHGDVSRWDRLFDELADFQILFCEPADVLIAAGHTAPFVWDGSPDDLPSTIDEILERALRDRSAANTLSALAALVSPGHRSRGLSVESLKSMRSLAAGLGLRSLLAPVRPTLKGSYPLMPFERYVEWRREDGEPFDPWPRVHYRLGAEPIKVMPESLVVSGSVPEWEKWTGMSFPESGEHIVPGALQPVRIGREGNKGRYEDPNVWMLHPVTEEAPANRSER